MRGWVVTRYVDRRDLLAGLVQSRFVQSRFVREVLVAGGYPGLYWAYDCPPHVFRRQSDACAAALAHDGRVEDYCAEREGS